METKKCWMKLVDCHLVQTVGGVLVSVEELLGYCKVWKKNLHHINRDYSNQQQGIENFKVTFPDTITMTTTE